MQLHHRLVSILRRVRQDVATLLDKEAINAACREENYSWKNRLLNPANTVHLFILQWERKRGREKGGVTDIDRS